MEAEYPEFPVVGSRVAIWSVAQLHLLFAAFVLAVPLFAFIVEVIGYKTGDLRYDRLAHEFTKLLSVSFSLTATFGAFLTFMLIILYPKFTNYLMSVFSPTFLPYVLLFFAEAFFLYTYYYGWGKFHPLVHLGLGLGLNLVGTAIMFIANAWLTFMMSPRGISDTGAVLSVWDAIYNYTWMPINVHRVIANIAFGGSVAAAYAAFKFLQAKTDEERAHYDWMGYIGNFVAISAFLPLPFAGYWLAKEIYAFSQTLGLTMMGGAFSWLFIIQAVLIGNLFLAANYYLWLGMGRVEGVQPLQRFIKYLLFGDRALLHGLGDAAVDHRDGLRGPGDGRVAHPVLGYLGVMSAKNTAVNILILTTFMSFLLYRRTGKVATVAWAKTGHAAQLTIFAAARCSSSSSASTGTSSRRRSGSGSRCLRSARCFSRWCRSPPSTSSSSAGRRRTGEVRWGKIPAISQYVLIFIAVTFTWLMGLMGYVRSGLRQHWHVYGVIRDTLGRRVHAHARLRDEGRLGDRARVLPPDWLRVLDHEPARPARFRRANQGPPSPTLRRGLAGAPSGQSGSVADMRVPLIGRIGALVLATTGFYAYVGQMVPQKEVQPPQEIVLKTDLTTADMVKVGREIMEGKGLCLPATRSARAGRSGSPTSRESAPARRPARPGLSDVDYFAQSMYEPDAFIVPGFNPGMPAINKPPIGLTDQEILCVIAYLQTLGGTPTVTLQTKHRYNAAARAGRRHLPPGVSPGGRSLRLHSREEKR